MTVGRTVGLGVLLLVAACARPASRDVVAPSSVAADPPNTPPTPEEAALTKMSAELARSFVRGDAIDKLSNELSHSVERTMVGFQRDDDERALPPPTAADEPGEPDEPEDNPQRFLKTWGEGANQTANQASFDDVERLVEPRQ
jgi:hypothetical protein